MAINIMEQCQISPSEGAPTEQLLPLLYFDMIWLHAPYAEVVFFYNLHCSNSHFFQTVVVKLKLSLSLTLKHFLPLAGNIVFPLSSPNTPFSHYLSGDSISLTTAVSSSDFSHLTGNHSRDADEFHDFVPEMPPPTRSSSAVKFPVVAIQLTFFPNQGFCIGFTQHHAICDGVNLFDGFIHKWASINKFNGDCHVVKDRKALPSYDRRYVQHAERLDHVIWKEISTCSPLVALTLPLPSYKVRRTFVLSDSDIQKLKNSISGGRVSSFVVASSYVWSCLAKSGDEEIPDDEPEYLTSPVDCRARLRPPLPENYFGNCLIFMKAKSTHGKLRGNEGLVAAVEAIKEAIDTTRIVDAFENRAERDSELEGKRWLRTAVSPRFDIYGSDYGWGRPVKFECIHTDFDGAVSLCRSRDGGIEIGMSLSKLKMDAFAAVFNGNLRIKSSL